MDTPLYGDYVTKISILDASPNPRPVYVTDTIILFSKWLPSTSCLGYQYNALPFQNTQTQGYLVKELHLNCLVGLDPRFSNLHEEKMSRRYSIESFKKR